VWLGLFALCFKINLLFSYSLWHKIGRLACPPPCAFVEVAKSLHSFLFAPLVLKARLSG
jgi:hypothetical protein